MNVQIIEDHISLPPRQVCPDLSVLLNPQQTVATKGLNLQEPS
jgi:hypothetical protein